MTAIQSDTYGKSVAEETNPASNPLSFFIVHLQRLAVFSPPAHALESQIFTYLGHAGNALFSKGRAIVASLFQGIRNLSKL